MLSDPIVALATPPGKAALAVIRMSGDGVFAIAGALAPGFSPDPPRTAKLHLLVDTATGASIDQAIVIAYKAPSSYTGEDMVELICHGGVAVPRLLLSTLVAGGARPAEPGEFTRRAVINGKMDLVQAEAVGDLIEATAKAQVAAAVDQISGALSNRVELLRQQLLSLSATLTYEIDFPDEDDGPIPIEVSRRELTAVQESIASLLQSWGTGERLRMGALVVLAGRPNAGKSSLFNALLGTDRALVTEYPGTTRDTVTADTEMLGWPIKLADTAGLREGGDPVERLGIEVSRRYLEQADLVLLCIEGGAELDSEALLLADRYPTVIVNTKADLVDTASVELSPGRIWVSARSGMGLLELQNRIIESVFPHAVSSIAVNSKTSIKTREGRPLLVTHERHRLALVKAAEALAAAAQHWYPGRDAALAAHHLEIATRALEDLIGRLGTDDILGEVFSRFCVGK